MTMLEGTLSKWTNVMKGWQYRWFVLDENAGLLSYYTSKEKMMKGVRRGCVRLKGAVIGVDDQDVNLFTITVDHKTFHFQARDADEREKWVRRLEDTIARHANRGRGIWDNSQHNNSIYNTTMGISSTKRPNHLNIFDKKVSEADSYLQLMIEQTAKIETRITNMEDEEDMAKCKLIQDHANAMLDNIKHSIVLLQIAKNTAHPVNGIYQGPCSSKDDPISDTVPPAVIQSVQSGIEVGSECIENRRRSIENSINSSASIMTLVVPETSYSSSEGEDDFFDANDDTFTSSQGNSPTSTNVRTIPEPIITSDLESSSDISVTQFNKTLGKQQQIIIENDNENEVRSKIHENRVHDPRALPVRSDGTVDYDALYEDESESDLSMETHGSVVTHLLSQVKIGMDLTKVVLPTFILERRSLLEMYADYFAHPDLFLRIPDFSEPRDRMIQVVKWYLSAYHAGRKSAVAKKPYNPILGEIFQCHWDVPELIKEDDPESVVRDGPVPWCRSNQLTFIAEQVSHHPPISAFYAEHLNKKISFSAHVWTKSKFLGLSIGVHNIGQGVVTLCDLDEEYIVTFPNGYGRSILTVPWIELGGSVNITCPRTGYHADIEFLTKPFYGGKRNRITAEIYAPNEKKSFMSIAGEWSGLMEVKLVDNKQKSEPFVDVNRIPIYKKKVRSVVDQTDNESRKVWREVTAGLKSNNIDRATNAKCQVEQKQREEAKTRKDTNGDWDTKYFKQVGENWIFTNSLAARQQDSKR